MATPSPAHARSDLDRKLSAIHHTYPAWSIRQRTDHTWVAIHSTTPTPARLRAGMQHFIVHRSLDDLVTALSQQLLIAQLTRAA